jgi:phosphate transport system protein
LNLFADAQPFGPLLKDVLVGAQVEEMVERAAIALFSQTLDPVQAAIDADRDVDTLAHHIEAEVACLLASQTSEADVAILIVVLRSVHEIERIGDLMTKVAKARRRLYPYQVDARVRGILDQMRHQSRSQLQLAIEAFANLDVAKAAAVIDMDEIMDDLQRDLFRHILSDDQPPLPVQVAVELSLIGRYLERAGDHATNVAEKVRSLATTQHLPPPAD